MSVHKKGLFTFTRELVEHLRLTEGFTIVQDEDKTQNWYIEPSKATDAFKVRVYKDVFAMQSAFMAQQICSSVGAGDKIKMMIAKEPDDKDKNLYAIITKSAVPIGRVKK